MRYETSFTRIENELVHGFRNRVNTADSALDVQNAFAAFVREILSRISGGDVVLDEGDVRVEPGVADGFRLGPGITQNKDYARALADSDLLDVLRRQAVEAVNRLKRLGKHTVRSEAKMFPRPDRRF